ncbi:FAD-binding oxidoreductase [Campylobacter coli]|nr:FAD-binding oxidoreductase [Campylobacter coli]
MRIACNGMMMTNLSLLFGSHCGMEVVLANGEILRTGMGALPKAKTFADLWKTDECGVKRLSYK